MTITSRLRLAPDGERGAPSPARAALAQAISVRDEAERTVTNNRTAIARGTTMLEGAAAEDAAATRAVEEARTGTAARLVEAATSGASPSADKSMRQARARLGDAEDDLEAKRRALASLRAKLTEAEAVLTLAKAKVDVAADDVIRASAQGATLAEAKALHEKLIETRLALRFLFSHDLIAERETASAIDWLLRAELPPAIGLSEDEDWDVHPASIRLQQARAALTRDANALWPPR